MLEVETKVREMIVETYGSLMRFCDKIDMPWATADSILKRGFANSNISNVMKMTRELRIDTESLTKGKIVPAFVADKELSMTERDVLEQYRKLDKGDKLKLEGFLSGLLADDKYKKDTVQTAI